MELVSEGVGDNFYWTGTSSGNFSVKSAIELIRRSEADAPKAVWKHIWQVMAPEKIRNFLWLVSHDSILSNANRQRRHLAASSDCVACNDSMESTLHILRDCPVAASVWSQLVPGARRYGFFHCNLEDWLSKNLCRNDAWSPKFAVGVWWLWRWRNMRCFEACEDIPSDRAAYIEARTQEYQAAYKRRVEIQSLEAQPASHWRRPTEGWMKLNCDGSYSIGQDKIGAGGIIRNEKSDFICAFVAKAGGDSPLKAELLGLFQGLTLAKHMKVQQLEVESDALTVVNNMEDRNSSQLHRILSNKCRTLLQMDGWNTRIRHVPRSCNQAADWLAKFSIQCVGDFTLFNNPPDALVSILELDLWMSENM